MSDKTRRRALCLLATVSLLLLPFSGCGRQPVPQNTVASKGPVLKVAVFADGRLTIDGAPSTIEILRKALQNLKQRDGVVWYYREAADQEPPAIAMKVMNAVIEAEVPILLSSRPDYSDSIDDQGRSVPIR